MPSPETSIIIRTFNEEKHLPGLLESLGGQTYRDFEIVVVDSGSLDRTRDIAAPWAHKLLRIQSHDFTFGYSLNVGIESAGGQYAVIISAHTAPVNGEWLENLLEPLRQDSTAMSFGRQIGWQKSNPGEVNDLQRAFGPRRKVLRPPHYFAHNGNSAIRKDLWQMHRFDETLPGLEDIEWAKHWMERGYQVVYEPEAVLYHIHDENWRQVRRRYYREALAARWIGVKGRRHVLLDSAKELAYAVQDLGQALWPGEGHPVRKGGIPNRGREVLLFRLNKAMGTARGLLDGAAMQDQAARERLFFDRTGTAVVIHGPGRASLEEVRIPEVKPGDVLVRTAYSGISGTDLEIFNGTLGDYKSGKANYPIVPGHEVSGRVVATGPNVSAVKEGDPVVVEHIQSCGTCPQCRRSDWIGCAQRTELGIQGLDGGYAQFVVVPGRFVRPVPSGLDLRKASLCQPLAMILKGLNRLSRSWPATPETKRCAVVGAGSLGHLCARVLALRGHDVTAIDRDPRRRSYFQGSGIKTSDDMGSLAEYDALVELTGDPEVLEAMLQASAPGATILLLGLPYAQRQFTFDNIVSYDKTVVGSVGSTSQEYEEALKLLPQINVDALLQCILPLDQYRQGWDHFRQHNYLKVLLSLGDEPQ